MKTYKWISSVIEILALIVSILVLIVTFYFSKQVSKLAKETNNIAKQSVNLQRKQIKLEVNKGKKQLFVESFNTDKTTDTTKSEQLQEEKMNTQNYYKQVKERMKINEIKKWKAKNNQLKKYFLKNKK